MKVFIGCGSKKRDIRSRAKDLYIGQYFKTTLEYAKSISSEENIFILSAKHGIISLDKELDPYNFTLKGKKELEKKKWAYRVIKQCEEIGITKEEKIIFICGRDYNKYLKRYFRNHEIPFENLAMGRQMKRIRQLLNGEENEKNKR